MSSSQDAGNTAAMREALEKVLEILNREWDAHRETSAMWEMQEICTAALAAPPRNCDVGTSQEQEARFEAFCHAHRSRERCCEDCPIVADRASCELAWAQMPYRGDKE